MMEPVATLQTVRAILNTISVRGEQDVKNMGAVLTALGQLQNQLSEKQEKQEEI